MKILSFGHIPSWAGGRQESGLANVIYNLALNMSNVEGIKMYLSATDVFTDVDKRDNLTILGWTKSGLIGYSILHPFMTLKWLVVLIAAKIKYGPTVNYIGFLFKGLHLAKSINLVRPDAVHLHGMTACIYNKIIDKKVKVIVTMHGMIGNSPTIPNHKYLSLMERSVCRSNRYEFIGFISSKLIADFESLYGNIVSKSKVFLNAYDNESFYYIEPKVHTKMTLLSIASLSENKGQMRVLKALAQSKSDIKYICVGAGTSIEITNHLLFAKTNNIDFEYAGKKTPAEIREILANVDYVIQPSYTEGFGLVFLESIACGVPVILPKHLPIVLEDVIKPDVNAILLEDSTVESIIDCLQSLKTNSFQKKSIAKTVSNYTWKQIAQLYCENFKI